RDVGKERAPRRRSPDIRGPGGRSRAGDCLHVPVFVRQARLEEVTIGFEVVDREFTFIRQAVKDRLAPGGSRSCWFCLVAKAEQRLFKRPFAFAFAGARRGLQRELSGNRT